MQETVADKIADRITARLSAAGITAQVSVTDTQGLDSRLLDWTWVAITSSRLGQNPILHREVCRMISLCMLECRRRDAVLVVAKGSAVEPWAARASELFAVPILKIAVDGAPSTGGGPCIEIQVTAESLSRDAAVIAIGDRVDAVYVRAGGTIDQCLRDRLVQLGDVSTRVAVTSLPKCAGRDLIGQGAIGWLSSTKDSSDLGDPAHQCKSHVIAASDSDQTVQENAWMHQRRRVASALHARL